MVAYDELGSLVPIKRTLQVIDYHNQPNKDSEVREKENVFVCSLSVFLWLLEFYSFVVSFWVISRDRNSYRWRSPTHLSPYQMWLNQCPVLISPGHTGCVRLCVFTLSQRVSLWNFVLLCHPVVKNSTAVRIPVCPKMRAIIKSSLYFILTRLRSWDWFL